jgi:hypothetical protein
MNLILDNDFTKTNQIFIDSIRYYHRSKFTKVIQNLAMDFGVAAFKRLGQIIFQLQWTPLNGITVKGIIWLMGSK